MTLQLPSRFALTALALFAGAGCRQASQPALEAPDLSQLAASIRWGGVVTSVLVAVAALVGLRMLAVVAKRLGAQYVSQRPRIQRVESLLRLAIYVVTVWLVVTLSFRADAWVLLLVGGGLVLGVGLALRDLLAALVAGVALLLVRPFQVGDRVRYGETYGDVLSIGLHSVRIRTLDQVVVTVPNHKVLSDVTATSTDGSLDMAVTLEFFIAVDQDAELAERLVSESLLTSRYAHLEKPVTTELSQLLLPNGYAALRILGRAHVHDARYERAFQSDVTRRVLRAFRKHRLLSPAMIHRVDLDRGEKRSK
ncbi:MAG: mechanosensitive ion channel [Deltaproteobacteria bacterium]|jgi:small-conductance mechanosensitive channel|nr:mechanosensitive ion channel [Deltaproteobacteria bacterium]MBW2535037.1 mechanosensitive ion channel [Deltaproteobacteria bacterium]